MALEAKLDSLCPNFICLRLVLTWFFKISSDETSRTVFGCLSCGDIFLQWKAKRLQWQTQHDRRLQLNCSFGRESLKTFIIRTLSNCYSVSIYNPSRWLSGCPPCNVLKASPFFRNFAPYNQARLFWFRSHYYLHICIGKPF